MPREMLFCFNLFCGSCQSFFCPTGFMQKKFNLNKNLFKSMTS